MQTDTTASQSTHHNNTFHHLLPIPYSYHTSSAIMYRQEQSNDTIAIESDEDRPERPRRANQDPGRNSDDKGKKLIARAMANADECAPLFTPGSIEVHFQGDYAAMVSLDIIEEHHYGTRWGVQNLSWVAFHKNIHDQLKIKVSSEKHVLWAEVGLPKMLECNDTKSWRLAMQMMHDK